MISVCMATYNGAAYIEEQVVSILDQLPEDGELVIADDGSTDNTLKILADFGDPRIRILETSDHLGPTYNLERALREAKGEFIFLADQDDRWLPGKVDSVMHLLKRSSLVLHDAYLLKPAGDTWARRGLVFRHRPPVHGVIRNWWKNSFTGCCMAFRREVLIRSLPFPANLPMHDQWLGLVAEKYYSVTFLKEALIEYRIHGKNATHLVDGNSNSFFKKIKWRWNLWWGLQTL